MERVRRPEEREPDPRELVARAVDCSVIFGHSEVDSYEFGTAEEALAHRARLGIRRGFLDWRGADTWSAFHASRRIEAFCRAGPWRGRAFPVLTLHPAQLVARGVEAEMARMIERNPRALFRLLCAGSEANFRVGVRFFAEHAQDRRLLLLLPIREAPSLGLLIEFARRYPHISFVLTEHSWGQHTALHAAMSEAENILADTMLLHVNEGIEVFVERYGAGRLLFNLGYRALGGAALGAVLTADISAQAKADILFGNVERALNLPPPSPAAGESPQGDRGGGEDEDEWWHFVRHGRSRHPVIDAHGHLGEFSAWPIRTQELEAQLAAKARAMTKQNVRYFIVSNLLGTDVDPQSPSGNAHLEEKLAKLGDDRILAYFSYNPHYAEQLDPYLPKVPRSKVFIGFKVHGDVWRVPLSDRSLDPMWRIADQFELPVLLHTWMTGYSRPGLIDTVASRFPGAKILLGHVGGNDEGRKEAEAMARKHPNVYLEWCGSFINNRKPWEQTVRELGAHKLIFGTDTWYHSHEWELARLLSQPFSAGELRRILFSNMMEIMSPTLPKRDLTRLF